MEPKKPLTPYTDAANKLKTIKVYGKLKDFLGQSVFQAAVKSPIQAVNFLKANFTGIEKHMNNQIYKVKIGCSSVFRSHT